MSTINALMYSILPWPQGWSASTFFCDILNPSIVTTDEPASEILFNPSDIIAIEFASTPITNLNIDNKTFTIIPVMLDSIPYFSRTSIFCTLSLSLINSLIKNFVIFFTPHLIIFVCVKYYSTFITNFIPL